MICFKFHYRDLASENVAMEIEHERDTSYFFVYGINFHMK